MTLEMLENSGGNVSKELLLMNKLIISDFFQIITAIILSSINNSQISWHGMTFIKMSGKCRLSIPKVKEKVSPV